MGSFATGGNYRDADPRLVAIAQAAAARSPYNVVLFSGERSGNSRSQHYGGNAIDIVLIDPQTGREIPNLGAGGDAFSAYESFARTMRATQQEIAPDLAGSFRWGGYFGPTGLNSTGLDLMHFDLGPTQNMALGTWEGGLNERGRTFVAQAGNGQIYSASGQTTAPMAYTASQSTPAGQGAIAASTGPAAGLSASEPAPGSQRLFRPVSEAIEARQAGGTPRLDELANIIGARRMGETPLLDRLRSFVETWRQNRQGTAPTPPAPIPNAPRASGGGSNQRGDPAIAQLQQELQAAGFNPGPIDGIMGPRTQAAMAARDAQAARSTGNPVSSPDKNYSAFARLGLPFQAAQSAPDRTGGGKAPPTPVPLPRPRPEPVNSGMGSYNPTARTDFSIPVGTAQPNRIAAPQPGSLTAGRLTPSGPYNPPAPMDFGIPIGQQQAPSFGAPPPGSLMTGSLTPSGSSGFGNPNPMANLDFNIGIGARGPASVPTPSANPTLGPMLAGYNTPGNGVGVPTTPVSRGVLPDAQPTFPYTDRAPPMPRGNPLTLAALAQMAPNAPQMRTMIGDPRAVLPNMPQLDVAMPGWGQQQPPPPMGPAAGPGAGGRAVATAPGTVDRGQMFGVQNGFMPAMRNDFGDMSQLPAFAETNPYLIRPQGSGMEARPVTTTTPPMGSMLPFNRSLPFPPWWRQLMGAGV